MEAGLPVPFIAGDPVPPGKFFGRWVVLEEIAWRLVAYGQSTSVTGEPKSGKTSLLKYLEACGIRGTSYAEHGSSLRFTFVDCQALPKDCTWGSFWGTVFHPFDAEWAGDAGALGMAYRRAREQQFHLCALEDFLKQLEQTGQRCVLLLDERDTLLGHPMLYHSDFLGGFRSVITNSQALTLVSAGRMGLEDFNRKSRELRISGSDYLNFAPELVLGPLDEPDEVILQGGEEFRRLYGPRIRYWADGHPFLLQAAASALWKVFTSRVQPTDAACKEKEAWERFYLQAQIMMDEAWALWSPLKRCALTLIALPEMERVGKFYSHKKLYRLWNEEHLEPECKWLEKCGYIQADAGAPTGWRVGPRAVVWWLEEELCRLARSERAFEEWVRESRWGGIMTVGDKERVTGIVPAVCEFVKETLTAFLKAVGEGLGKAAFGNT